MLPDQGRNFLAWSTCQYWALPSRRPPRTALARRHCLKVKSNTHALRWGTLRLSTSSSSAVRPRAPCASTALHSGMLRTQLTRPAQPKWTAPHTSHKAFALELRMLVIPRGSRFKLGRMTLPVHAMSVPAPVILFPPTLSLSFLFPPGSLLLLRCSRLVPYSLASPVPSLSCGHSGGAAVDDDSARTSSCQDGGGRGGTDS
jgi:hypothetical protein